MVNRACHCVCVKNSLVTIICSFFFHLSTCPLTVKIYFAIAHLTRTSAIVFRTSECLCEIAEWESSLRASSLHCNRIESAVESAFFRELSWSDNCLLWVLKPLMSLAKWKFAEKYLSISRHRPHERAATRGWRGLLAWLKNCQTILRNCSILRRRKKKRFAGEKSPKWLIVLPSILKLSKRQQKNKFADEVLIAFGVSHFWYVNKHEKQQLAHLL